MVLARTDMMVVSKLNNIELKFNSFNFSDNDEHINKMPFSGICLMANKPSDGIPCGSDKPVAFSNEAITNALSSFVNMGVNCRYDDYGAPECSLTGHDTRFKIGVVEEATVQDGDNVFIKGSLWKHDFYDVCFMIKNAKDSLGFSVEVCVNEIEDSGDFYLVKDFTFTGVSILYKNLAAFKATQLAAQRNFKKESDGLMEEKQFKEFMDAVNAIGTAVSEKVDAVNLALGDMKAKLEAIEAKETKIDFSDVTASIKELGEKLPKSPATPAPKTGMSFVGKGEKKKIDFSSIHDSIMNDPTIPNEMKARAMIDAMKNKMSGEGAE